MFLLTVFSACSNKSKDAAVPSEKKADMATIDTAENFFPVTSYLRGEVAQISKIGITPVRKNIKNGITTDSSWLKPEQYDAAFADFFTPVIDTANLKASYIQNKFLDQSVDAFTFTYDPKKDASADLPLRHWDLYIDPKSQNVTRVFIKRKTGPDEEKQLTWQSGKWCRIIKIKNTGTNPAITGEVKIDWSFE